MEETWVVPLSQLLTLGSRPGHAGGNGAGGEGGRRSLWPLGRRDPPACAAVPVSTAKRRSWSLRGRTTHSLRRIAALITHLLAGTGGLVPSDGPLRFPPISSRSLPALVAVRRPGPYHSLSSIISASLVRRDYSEHHMFAVLEPPRPFFLVPRFFPHPLFPSSAVASPRGCSLLWLPPAGPMARRFAARSLRSRALCPVPITHALVDRPPFPTPLFFPVLNTPVRAAGVAPVRLCRVAGPLTFFPTPGYSRNRAL